MTIALPERMRLLMCALATSLIALGACKTTSSTPAASPAKAESGGKWKSPSGRDMPTLQQPQKLPASARMSIARKMQNHGDDMTVMLWAMLFLDFESAGEIADAIATEPRLARPLDGGGGGGDVNTMLPPRFFELQDDLRSRAANLVALSSTVAPEPEAFAGAFGELAATCVRCHTVYLNQ